MLHVVEPSGGADDDAAPPRSGNEKKDDDDAARLHSGNEKEDEGTATATGAPQHVKGDSVPAASHKLARQKSYAAHTQEEVVELETMVKAITSTPRKAKRVYNM